VAALAKTIPFIVDHIVAEWQAMQFCYELGYRGAIFKGDSLIVVLALRQVSTCWQGFRQLLEDIKIKLNSLSFFFFFFFFFLHFRRDANQAAHRLAKVALSQSLDQVWIEGCSSFIQSIVLVEQDLSLD